MVGEAADSCSAQLWRRARPRPWVCVLPRHLSQIRLVKSRNTRLRDTGSQSRSFCTYPSSLTRCQRRRRLPDCAARPLFFRQPCRNPSGPTIRRREGSHRTWRDGRGRAMGRGKESRTSRSWSVADVDDVVVDPSVGRSVCRPIGGQSAPRGPGRDKQAQADSTGGQARFSVFSSHTRSRTSKEIETNRICLSLIPSNSLSPLHSFARGFRQSVRSVVCKFVIVTFLASLFSRQFHIRCHSFT